MEVVGLVLLAGIFVAPIYVGYRLGQDRGSPILGLVLGLLLSWLGVLIVALLPRKGRCPWCAEPVQREAVVCPHCHRDIAGRPAPQAAR